MKSYSSRQNNRVLALRLCNIEHSSLYEMNWRIIGRLSGFPPSQIAFAAMRRQLRGRARRDCGGGI